ncbi:MAG: discoidin domain-containing protein [Prevotellamassilia sp.]
MYLETVGTQCYAYLEPPARSEWLSPDHTVNRMKELGQMMKTRLGNDLARTAKVVATEERTKGDTTTMATNVIDDNKNTYWATNDGTTSATLTFTWDEAKDIRYVSMMEFIRLGQRVKSFTIETSEDGQTFTKRGGNIKTTTIGYKRIIPLNGSTSNSYVNPVRAKVVKITINDAKACPLLHTVSIY